MAQGHMNAGKLVYSMLLTAAAFYTVEVLEPQLFDYLKIKHEVNTCSCNFRQL